MGPNDGLFGQELGNTLATGLKWNSLACIQTAELQRAVVNGQAVRNAEVEIYCKDRSRKWLLVNLQGLWDGAGNILLVDGTTEDITARKVAEEPVQFLAYFDALAGLPNQALMHDRLAQAHTDGRISRYSQNAGTALSGEKAAAALDEIVVLRRALKSMTVDNRTEFASEAMDRWS